MQLYRSRVNVEKYEGVPQIDIVGNVDIRRRDRIYSKRVGEQSGSDSVEMART